jgi:hypothetical protein
MNNQRGSVNVWPEKLYTQREVDDLFEKRGESQEHQDAKNQKMSENRTVAGMVKRSNRILVSISSHALPFDFFPDEINVEEGRITIINRHILSSEVHSVDIKDISNIFINTTLFFSQLVIISKTFEENQIRIRNLRPSEAVFVRRIIEGLRELDSKQIDTSSYSKEELVSKLQELSTTEIVT